MGNDGGSIPKRRELVKEAARNPTTAEIKETALEKQEYLWTTDPLSNKPLQPPIVSDCTGKLYNKDSILEYLLGTVDEAHQDEYNKLLDGNVKSLKDIVEVRFESEEGSEAGEGQQRNKSNGSGGVIRRWKCPITTKVLGPQQKAVYLVPCGHVFSAIAVRELKETRCQQCDSEFASNDAIPIIPVAGEDIARLSLRIKDLRERGLSHALKKVKGEKKRKAPAEAEAQKISSGLKTNGSSITDNTKDPTTIPTTIPGGGGGLKNSSTASLTAKILSEQDSRNKKRKIDMKRNENLSSLFTKDDGKSKKDSGFMTRGFIIPADARR